MNKGPGLGILWGPLLVVGLAFFVKELISPSIVFMPGSGAYMASESTSSHDIPGFVYWLAAFSGLFLLAFTSGGRGLVLGSVMNVGRIFWPFFWAIGVCLFMFVFQIPDINGIPPVGVMAIVFILMLGVGAFRGH